MSTDENRPRYAGVIPHPGPDRIFLDEESFQDIVKWAEEAPHGVQITEVQDIPAVTVESWPASTDTTLAQTPRRNPLVITAMATAAVLGSGLGTIGLPAPPVRQQKPPRPPKRYRKESEQERRARQQRNKLEKTAEQDNGVQEITDENLHRMAGALRDRRPKSVGWYAYQNKAMDSSSAGSHIFMLCGEGCTHVTPPEQAPDGYYGAGWKFQLVGRADVLAEQQRRNNQEKSK